MKLRKTLLLSVLFLALGATFAGATPVPTVADAPETVAVQALTIEAEAPGDCEEPLFQAVTFKADFAASLIYTCGSCSQNPCKGAGVNTVCGYQSGRAKYCQDYLGDTCAADGGALCRCSNAPLP